MKAKARRRHGKAQGETARRKVQRPSPPLCAVLVQTDHRLCHAAVFIAAFQGDPDAVLPRVGPGNHLLRPQDLATAQQKRVFRKRRQHHAAALSFVQEALLAVFRIVRRGERVAAALPNPGPGLCIHAKAALRPGRMLCRPIRFSAAAEQQSQDHQPRQRSSHAVPLSRLIAVSGVLTYINGKNRKKFHRNLPRLVLCLIVSLPAASPGCGGSCPRRRMRSRRSRRWRRADRRCRGGSPR